MNNVYDPRSRTIKRNGKTYDIDLGLYGEAMELPNGIGVGRLFAETLIAYEEGEIDLQSSYDKLIEATVVYALVQNRGKTVR